MRFIEWQGRLVAGIALAIAVGSVQSGAQVATSSAGGRTATVSAGPDYDAGWLKRKLLGEGWRDLWVTPVNARLLDMGSYAGGLKVVRPGGGNQTLTLHFAEKDDYPEYLFRSVNKFPVGQAMPAEIHDTPLGSIIQDQVSTLLPAGALMLPPLLRAAGVLHVDPDLYLMPDDPRLGEHRKDFAGLLGTVELSPQEGPDDKPGFADSRKITGGEGFLKDIDSTRAHRLNEREFFAMRLVDFLVNDNDRTADNVRFVRYGKDGAYTWRPLPRDRDRAFTDARGLVVQFIVRPVYPKLISFSPDYDLKGLTFESHNLDRRLLQRLTREDTEEIANRVRRAIDDNVIEAAIGRLPAEWRQKTDVVTRLRSTLRARRNDIPVIAREFYDWLASDVDVHGTDDDERATLERHQDGRVTVTVRGKDEAGTGEPYSRRTFIPGETKEVRVHLHGGNDVAVIRGARSDDITLRVIGGGGDDLLADSAGGGATRFYDSRGDNRFVEMKGTRVSERDWKAPRQGAGIRLDAPWRPDWGESFGWGPAFDYVDGGGVVVGYGPRYRSFGFRRLPHKWQSGANVLVGLGNGRFGVNMNADYRFENSPMALTLDARGTRFEAFRFHGFGNDVPLQPTNVARIDEDIVSIEPRLVKQIGWRSREDLGSGLTNSDSAFTGLRPLVGKVYGGPLFLSNRAHPDDASPLSDAQGDQTVARAGLRLGMDLDQTSPGPASDRGWNLEARASAFPPVFDIDKTVTTLAAVGAAYLPLPVDGMHFAFRLGGRTASGPYPVQEAASIGGRSTVRGYTSRRYTGDRSAFGSAELRLPVGTVPLFVRWKLGVFGLADVGRVWLDGESPGGWHSGFGGGLWLSSLGQAFSVAFANGEGNRFYIKRGLSF
ncbi:MAG: hypothetical protein H0U59_02370 [Gemmatimonadaceae bacterium]|nr:hypothetical protein [Gemmatimonadaceae bacterium]